MSATIARRTMVALGRPATPARATRIGGGRASEVYLVQAEDRDVVAYVLPTGTGREARRRFAVLARIAEQFPLAPKPVAIGNMSEEDDSSPLLLVERLGGVPPAACGSLAADIVRRLAANFVSALAVLHAIRIVPADRPPDYLHRSIKEWERRWDEEAAGLANEDFTAVVRWLMTNSPDQSACALLHNDFKLDNILVDPGDPARVVGVVDWEMANIGHPFADLGIALSYWIESRDPLLLRLEAPGPSCAPGAPTRPELVDLYVTATGSEVESAAYWYAYGLLRLAVVTQNLALRPSEDGRRVPRSRLIVRTLLTQASEICGSGRL